MIAITSKLFGSQTVDNNTPISFVWERQSEFLYMMYTFTFIQVFAYALLQFCYLSCDMKFPTAWYVRLAKPQINLRIRAV